MRVWLFKVLAVLATFQLIVQVASTEDRPRPKLMADDLHHRHVQRQQQRHQQRHQQQQSTKYTSLDYMLHAIAPTNSTKPLSSPISPSLLITNNSNSALTTTRTTNTRRKDREMSGPAKSEVMWRGWRRPKQVQSERKKSNSDRKRSNKNTSNNILDVINAYIKSKSYSNIKRNNPYIDNNNINNNNDNTNNNHNRIINGNDNSNRTNTLKDDKVVHKLEPDFAIVEHKSHDFENSVWDVPLSSSIKSSKRSGKRRKPSSKSHNKPDRKMKIEDQKLLKSVEAHLLNMLGFTNRPVIKDRAAIRVPEEMVRLYEEASGKKLDLNDVPKSKHKRHAANTVRFFPHQESNIDHRFVHHHRFRYHFNVTTIPSTEEMWGAELLLSRDAIPDAGKVRHTVHVYDILRPGVIGKNDPRFKLLDTKMIELNGQEALRLDVQQGVERWNREPDRNYGLLVHVSGSPDGDTGGPTPAHEHVRLRRNANETHETWSEKQPILITYTDDHRHRRAATGGGGGNGSGTKDKGDGHGHHNNRRKRISKKRARNVCQRYELFVDFEDVGWRDWIVAPTGYDAYFCKGECRIPLAENMNSTNHAVVQSLVHEYDANLAPRACCVPTQLDPVPLLYIGDDNKVVLKRYDNMVVSSCGCR